MTTTDTTMTPQDARAELMRSLADPAHWTYADEGVTGVRVTYRATLASGGWGSDVEAIAHGNQDNRLASRMQAYDAAFCLAVRLHCTPGVEPYRTGNVTDAGVGAEDPS